MSIEFGGGLKLDAGCIVIEGVIVEKILLEVTPISFLPIEVRVCGHETEMQEFDDFNEDLM